MNLKLLPFMDEDKFIELYKKIKKWIWKRILIIFEYLKSTWINLEEGGNARFPPSLWSYYWKFNLEQRGTELLSKKLEDYGLLSNDAC